MKSFVEDVFIPKYYHKLCLRKDTFLCFFKELEKLDLKYYTIVETGTSRGGVSDIAGNGASTYMFDEFVNFYDGQVFSFDINHNSVKHVESTTTNKTKVMCMDSVVGINNLKNIDIFDIHGLYLDSVDTNFIDDNFSSTHALNELIASTFYFTNKTIILVDDTPVNTIFLPPWVKNDPNRGNNIEYMSKLSFPCGKGRQINDYIKNESNFSCLSHEYQLIFQYSIDNIQIPKIIHQTWKSKDIDYSIFKKEIVSSWSKHNPDYEIFLYDDNDNLSFIEKFYPWFLNIYKSYPKEIFRADAIRYFYMLHYGGIYADLDMECLKPITPYMKTSLHLITDKEKWVSNALMFSAPRQEFWKKVIYHGLMRKYKEANVLYATGPVMLSDVYYSKCDKIMQNNTHLPKHLFYPTEYYENIEKKLISKEIVTIHHFAHSWK